MVTRIYSKLCHGRLQANYGFVFLSEVDISLSLSPSLPLSPSRHFSSEHGLFHQLSNEPINLALLLNVFCSLTMTMHSKKTRIWHSGLFLWCVTEIVFLVTWQWHFLNALFNDGLSTSELVLCQRNCVNSFCTFI